MNIGLIDIDSHNFPNLVLMKLSAYHKAKGDTVDFVTQAAVLQGDDRHDKLYAACVFKGHEGTVVELRRKGVAVGGTGTPYNTTLSDEIEHIMPDYSLYGITDIAYGFLSRGCHRQCPFCIVSDKEGKAHKVADLSEWWSGQKTIKLLDPNLLATPEWRQLLKQLADSGAWVDFTQGLDARLLTTEVIEYLNAIKIKNIHFAWDNPEDGVTPGNLLMFMEKTTMSVKHRKPSVYVLTNYWSSFDEDLDRIYWLRDNGFDPYVMVYDKEKAPYKIRRLQRWVNAKPIFARVKYFEDY